MPLFKNGGQCYGKKVVELLYFENFNIKALQNNLKALASCSELVQKSPSVECLKAKNSKGGDENIRGLEWKRFFAVPEGDV